MDYETLLYERDDHVVTLTYNRPDQHNAINRTMNRELHDAWQRFRDDEQAFVLVITGAGETSFCAGWDLQDAAELSEPPDYDAFRVSLYNSPGECGYTRKVDIFKPVIAAVNGHAFAAGLETALLADIRIAAENADFGALERRWNIVGGDGMTVRLPLVVGFAKAMELIITGRRVDVDEAKEIGLVNEVVPPGKARQADAGGRDVALCAVADEPPPPAADVEQRVAGAQPERLECVLELALGALLERVVLAQIDPGCVDVVRLVGREQLHVLAVVVLRDPARVEASASEQERPHEDPRLDVQLGVGQYVAQVHRSEQVAVEVDVAPHVRLHHLELLERAQRLQPALVQHPHLEQRLAAAERFDPPVRQVQQEGKRGGGESGRDPLG
jgi:enoyl-CoA hydratase